MQLDLFQRVAEPPPAPPASPTPPPGQRPPIEIRVSTRRRKTVGAHWEGDTIVVLVPPRLSKRDRHTYAEELADRLIAARDRSRVTDARLDQRARELSVQYLGGRAVPTSVTWSSRQHARWGSCTAADGTIRVSDRLRHVPGWVLDAVLLHELAHLLCHGHGPEFKALVAAYPRLSEADAFLAGYHLGLSR